MFNRAPGGPNGILITEAFDSIISQPSYAAVRPAGRMAILIMEAFAFSIILPFCMPLVNRTLIYTLFTKINVHFCE